MLVPAHWVVMVTSRAALRLPPFDHAPSQTHLLAWGLMKDWLRHVFFLLNSFAKIFKFVFPVPTYILNHPFFIIMTNNSVDEFFVFLASPFARNKFIYI